MGDPAVDRMKYLAGLQGEAGMLPQSAGHSALMQEGYGANGGVAEGNDDPQSAQAILNKATASAICYYVSNYSNDAEGRKAEDKEQILGRLWPVLDAIWLGVIEATSPQEIREFVYSYINHPGRWLNLTRMKGFEGDSAFGQRVFYCMDNMTGGNTDAQREQYAVACVSTFSARWAAGENKNVIPNLTTFTLISNYFNNYYRAYEPVADPNFPLMCLLRDAAETTLGGSYAPVFKEINTRSEKRMGQEVTAFGFEDLSSVFTHPIDNQLEKDAELQAWAVEGELMYDPWWWYDSPNCEDTEVPLKNPQGKVTGYLNIGPTSFPCVDESRDITPVTGTVFSRTFIEAPPVSGTYDSVSSSYVADAIRRWYPENSYLSTNHFAAYEDFIDVNCRWITTYGQGANSPNNHPITDISNYEPYYFINNHEGNAGNPFPGWQCEFSNGAWCDGQGYYPLRSLCEDAGHTWVETNCIHPAPPSPSPFPGQDDQFGYMFSGTRDMSLRHSLRREDADDTIPYWEDILSWEFTGFAMAPLQFSKERVDTLYKDFYTNPILDAGNLGRRAFSYQPKPTSEVVYGTCGPPQQFANPNHAGGSYNMWGGPFIYAQFWAENRTKRQGAKINLFAGWPYRYYEDPYGTYDLQRTGGFNFPLISETFYHGWSEPAFTKGGNVEPTRMEFHGQKISNNFNVNGDRAYKYNGEDESFYIGTGVYPPGTPNAGLRYSGVWKSSLSDQATPWLPYGSPRAPNEWGYPKDQPDPFHYNQELITPQMVMGMGDGCRDIPTKTEWSLNAGQRYSYHSIDVTGITHPYLKTITGVIEEEINKYTNGVEEFFKPGILGQFGTGYWQEFTTGWINTGDYAGEAVHCLHRRTGISTTPGSPQAPEYYWLGTGDFDVHFNFPYQGIDCLLNHGPLSPYPNISRCCEFFTPPFNGDTGCLPTTTTTADPNATTTTTNAYNSSTTTTTTSLEDPSMPNCGTTGIKVECPGGEPFSMGYYEYTQGMCTYEQCISLSCPSGDNDNISWDSGVYPYQRDWVERKLKQRGENPPRYWYGPYASTHFTFLYPNAQAVLDIHYPTGQREDFPITGFPEKIFFDVEIEEYLVKDFVSGGYINADGEITWDKILKSEEGGPAPTFTTGNTGVSWGNFVDERYVPLIEAPTEPPLPGEEFETNYTKIAGKTEQHDIIVNYTLANGRNFETYGHPFYYDRGNQYATGISYGYGTTNENASFGQLLFPVGGFSKYSKYSFTQETTYAKPTFTLNTLENNSNSLVNALKPGNQLFYGCGGNGLKLPDLTAGLNIHGEQIKREAWDWVDPIYFLPMQSNRREVGIYNQGGLADNNLPFTGTLEHPKQIYGDRWMGIRPASMFSLFHYEIESGYNGHNTTSWVAGSPGNLVTAVTGKHGTHNVSYNSEYDPNCITDLIGEMNLGDDYDVYWCETLPECYGTCTGVEGPPAINEVRLTEHPCLSYEMSDEDHVLERIAADNKVWLFNLDASGIDVHVRAPDYLSGYIADPRGLALVGDGYGPNVGTMSVPERYLLTSKSSTASSATAALGFRVSGTNIIWNNKTSTASAGGGNKPIDFFKPNWIKDNKEISYQKVIYEEYGVLFEKPSDEGWEMGEDNQGNVTGYETIYSLGARKAEEGGSSDRIRVSGWKETSKVVINLSNFQIKDYGPFPNDSYFSMEESGNCQISGFAQYISQAEASIYSEGILMEDVSDDPLRDKLDYPHYASETIKRPGVSLPYGELPTGEWNPDFVDPKLKFIFPAPSKMMVRTNEWFIFGTGIENYTPLFGGEPYYYNRYKWPTRSDMSQWNGGSLSWEGPPAHDKSTYPVSELMISAQAGQPTPNQPKQSQFIQRKYALTQHIAFYDGVVLDPTINKEWMVDFAVKDGGLKYSVQPKSAYVVPRGTSILDVERGIVQPQKHTLKPNPTEVASWEDDDGGGVVGIIT